MRINNHLTIYNENTFKGLPLLIGPGPLYLEYLQITYDTILRARDHYNRVLAIRIDLHIPDEIYNFSNYQPNTYVSKFFKSLNAIIQHDQQNKLRRSHGCVLRYVWTREYTQEGRPHYHVLLLLNRDAYFSLGDFNSSKENMATRIVRAWSSALRVPVDRAKQLIFIPENATYHLDRFGSDQVMEDLFKRTSYLSKVDTKRYQGDWTHAFGCSRM